MILKWILKAYSQRFGLDWSDSGLGISDWKALLYPVMKLLVLESYIIMKTCQLLKKNSTPRSQVFTVCIFWN